MIIDFSRQDFFSDYATFVQQSTRDPFILGPRGHDKLLHAQTSYSEVEIVLSM